MPTCLVVVHRLVGFSNINFSTWFAGDPEGTVMEQDLKLCSVRPLNDVDRRYCFEVISPTKYWALSAHLTLVLLLICIDFPRF